MTPKLTSSNHSPQPIVDNPTTTTDTVIVGNGPSALFLSYLLHGNVPFYDSARYGPHPDPVLHGKLSLLGARPLYDALQSPEACRALTEHFPAATHMSYSTQALPINALLDTLVRPNADTEIGECESRLRWEVDASKAVSHVVLGSAPEAGGQWAEDPLSSGRDVKALSYAEMLSLPGYSFREHYRWRHGRQMPDLARPTRGEIADYYSAYPRAVGIASEVSSSAYVQKINRIQGGFSVKVYRKKRLLASSRPRESEPYMIYCKHVVLATGIFTNVIPPPPILLPLLSPPAMPRPCLKSPPSSLPTLVIGSGFTAADVILSSPPSQKIIHIYNWTPSSDPSPLKGCHSEEYPGYAHIYRRMRQSASPTASSTTHTDSYEGFPNARIIATRDGRTVKILTSTGLMLERDIRILKYCVGRRGSLEYLSPDLQKALCIDDAACVGKETLRASVERDFMAGEGLFVVGSLSGDGLVRWGLGGGVYAAGRIVGRSKAEVNGGSCAVV